MISGGAGAPGTSGRSRRTNERYEKHLLSHYESNHYDFNLCSPIIKNSFLNNGDLLWAVIKLIARHQIQIWIFSVLYHPVQNI